MTITMPSNDVLLALAMRLERRRREQTFTCGPESSGEHLEYMRNQILIAASDAERNTAQS